MQEQDYGLKTQIYMCEVSPDPTDVISLEASLSECGFSSISSNLPSGLLDNIHQVFFYLTWMNNRVMILFHLGMRCCLKLLNKEVWRSPLVSVRHSRVLRQNTDGGFFQEMAPKRPSRSYSMLV